MALAVAQRSLEGVDGPLALPAVDRQAVEDHRDPTFFRVEVRVLDPDRLALLQHPAKPGLLERLPHHRRAHLLPDAVGEAHQGGPALAFVDQPPEDRRRRVPAYGLPAAAAVQRGRPGVEGPQVVGHRGHGAHRGARGPHRRGAVHRHRREDALDLLRPRPVEPLQELPSVGAERLGVAPVSLGVEHVEGQRRLPGPRHPGHRGHRPDGHAHADALQVVLTSLLHLDVAPGHPPTMTQECREGKPTGRSGRGARARRTSCGRVGGG